jgi:hypothetical protein
LKALNILLGLGTLLGATALGARALELTTDQTDYYRYELVTLTAALGVSETAGDYPAELTAQVFQGKTAVVSVGKLKHVPLRRRNGGGTGDWPIPFAPVLGEYRAEVRVLDAAGVTRTAEVEFRVKGRDPYLLPPGFSVVTDEGGRQGPYATPGLSSDEPKSWKNLARWADAMGADALWECIGQTQVWGTFKPENFPWPADALSLARKVGQSAHDAGLKYGAWITAFVVIGQGVEATGYTFTTGYDRATGTLRPLRYVSLGCEKRLKDMADLLKTFEGMPEIDYLGLDYMRTDFGGYEFATEFVRDMSIPAPADWGRLSATERGLWMARLIEVTRDQSARDRWEWWRAHKVAKVVVRLLGEVKPTKPVWIFSLGWQTGHQHGQDIGMMRDAGIGFNAPMFYSLPKASFPEMIRDWQTAMARLKPSVVIGECVDWNLLERTVDPSGPQEHYDRQITALEKLEPHARSFGLFWHDLARAHYGARGPYGTMEWVMAGAASFARLKEKAGRIPFRVELKTPAVMVLDRDVPVHVTVTNVSGDTLTGVAAEFVPLPRLASGAAQAVGTIPPGESRGVTLHCRTDQLYAKNGGTQMIAVKARCAQAAARDVSYTFKYLPVKTEAEANSPVAHAAPPTAASPLPARSTP